MAMSRISWFPKFNLSAEGLERIRILLEEGQLGGTIRDDGTRFTWWLASEDDSQALERWVQGTLPILRRRGFLVSAAPQ